MALDLPNPAFWFAGFLLGLLASGYVRRFVFNHGRYLDGVTCRIVGHQPGRSGSPFCRRCGDGIAGGGS